MKFSIKREALLKPLQLSAGVVEKRQTKPILSNILLILKDNLLSLIGTDLEVELCGLTKLENSTEEPIEITLPGKKFLDICRNLPENSTLELSIDANRVTISSGNSRFVLSSLPASDFPLTPEQKKIVEISVSQKELKKLIEKTAFSIPQQDVRQYLNGLLLEVKDGQIKALATDGHRLALSVILLPIIDNSFAQVIIPRKAVFELLRLLESSEADIKLTFNDNFVRIIGSDFILTSKLISGKFPNYDKIIPKRGDKHLEINRDEFKQSLTRVGILSNESFRCARFQLQSDCLKLSSNNPEQEEAAEELIVDYQKDKLDATFNINYLIDVLNVIETAKVFLSFKGNQSGVLIEEVNGNTNCLYVLMPIRN